MQNAGTAISLQNVISVPFLAGRFGDLFIYIIVSSIRKAQHLIN
jgi:hypothetical protein